MIVMGCTGCDNADCVVCQTTTTIHVVEPAPWRHEEFKATLDRLDARPPTGWVVDRPRAVDAA